MMEEMDVRRLALDREEAARLTAGTRDHGMGAAALRSARREAEALAKLRVSGEQIDLVPVPTGSNAALPPADSPRSAPPPFRRRAALEHVLRK